MAGDSEQTLQNHQQPNGGEPFLIGVSGGTASGKWLLVQRCSNCFQKGTRHPVPSSEPACLRQTCILPCTMLGSR
uniref:Uridine-cytidine kinase 2 n=1 Tax=Mus musculus TaxID=10090 RepID=A0A0A6YX11_MOUSE